MAESTFKPCLSDSIYFIRKREKILVFEFRPHEVGYEGCTEFSLEGGKSERPYRLVIFILKYVTVVECDISYS